MIVLWQIGRYLIPVLRIVLILLHCYDLHIYATNHATSFPPWWDVLYCRAHRPEIYARITLTSLQVNMYSMRVRELETASLRWRCCNVDHTYSVWEWGIWNLTMHSAYKNKTNWTTPLIKFPVIPDNKLYPHLVKLLKFRPCSFVLIDL